MFSSSFFFLLFHTNSINCHPFLILPSNTHPDIKMRVTCGDNFDKGVRVWKLFELNAYWQDCCFLDLVIRTALGLVGDYGQPDAVMIKCSELNVILIVDSLIYVNYTVYISINSSLFHSSVLCFIYLIIFPQVSLSLIDQWSGQTMGMRHF